MSSRLDSVLPFNCHILTTICLLLVSCSPSKIIGFYGQQNENFKY